MLYSLRDKNNNTYYNFKRWNGNEQWTAEWWFAYKYQEIEKAEEHRKILEGHNFEIEIEKHIKKELIKIPQEKWNDSNQ